MRTYDLLNGGSRWRLKLMRQYADRWNAELHSQTKIDWRAARSHGTGKINGDAHGPTFQTIDGIDCANVPTCVLEGFVHVGYADKILDLRHTGWLTDPDGYAMKSGEGTYRGQVWKLPTRKRTKVYLAGFVDVGTGYAMLCANGNALELFDDEDEAARAADRLAERLADTEREYQRGWREASDLQGEVYELESAVKTERAKAKAVAKALRDQQQVGALANSVCNILREKFNAARECFSDALAKLIEKRAEFNEHPRCGDV